MIRFESWLYTVVQKFAFSSLVGVPILMTCTSNNASNLLNCIFDVAVGSFYVDFCIFWFSFSVYIVMFMFFSIAWILRICLLVITNILSDLCSLMVVLVETYFTYIVIRAFYKHFLCFTVTVVFRLLICILSSGGFSFFFGSSKLTNYCIIICLQCFGVVF